MAAQQAAAAAVSPQQAAEEEEEEEAEEREGWSFERQTAEALVAAVVAQWRRPIDTLGKAGRAFDVSLPSHLLRPAALLLRGFASMRLLPA
jgi:hypothetical protein